MNEVFIIHDDCKSESFSCSCQQAQPQVGCVQKKSYLWCRLLTRLTKYIEFYFALYLLSYLIGLR